jgi:predicted DNA-binding protein
MNTVQLGIRIPTNANQHLNAFIEQTGISKTEIVVNALAAYLGCISGISITERMASIEAKVTLLEALVNRDSI